MDINLLRDRPANGSLTVSELNGYIKSIFDNDRRLISVTVKGEISNFTNHRSGHLYFSLKDDGGQIRSVMFRSSAVGLKFMPEDGMRVIAHGSVSVYTRDGSYQLYVNSLIPDGVGALYLAYEQLKSKLEKEGLFDSFYKKPIPRYPTRIGVITSPTGAAVRDIINVVGRRYPLADIYLYPAIVQGEQAEESLIRAVDYFDTSHLVDTVIIGRGGGSIEDLWAFNSERLARRIFSAEVPVISAVGHETDFTICDFVADFRAPTPSAAAEISVPDIRELRIFADSLTTRLKQALIKSVSDGEMALERLEHAEIMRRPERITEIADEKIAVLETALNNAFSSCITSAEQRVALTAGKLEALSPISVLSRGYSLVEGDGTVIDTVTKLSVGQSVELVMRDGRAKAKVESLLEDVLYEKRD